MKKHTIKKNKPLTAIKDRFHQEIIVKPAKRLLDALVKAEKKEVTALIKDSKISTTSSQ